MGANLKRGWLPVPARALIAFALLRVRRHALQSCQRRGSRTVVRLPEIASCSDTSHNSSLETNRILRIVLGAGLLLTVVASAASAESGRFVALGDSYAAGAGAQPFDPIAPPGCSQSAINYAHLLAGELAFADFADVSCNAATLDNLSVSQALPQGQANPPQANALNGSETVVTVRLGGNDAKFGLVAANCLA